MESPKRLEGWAPVPSGAAFTRSDGFRNGLALLLMLAGGAVIAGGLMTGSPLVIFAGALALLVCAFIFNQPFWGVIAFLFVLFIRAELISESLVKMRLPILLSSFTLFAWIVQVVLKRERFRWRAETGWMLAFTVALILSTYRLPSMSDTVEGLMDTARLLCLFLLVQQLVSDERRANVAIAGLLVLTVVLALISIWGFYHGRALMENGVPRATVPGGGFDDPNDLAAVLVAGVPICLLYLARAKALAVRVVSGIGLAVLTFNIYLTNSRGGMIAFGVAVSVYLLYQLGWKRGLVIGLVALSLMVAFGPERFSAKSVKGDDSSMGRILAWRHGLQMFESNPLMGVGYGEFPRLHGMTAHNSFVLALSEGGFPGALLWVGLNYWPILTLVRLRRRQREEGSAGVLAGYTVALQAAILGSIAAQMFLSHTYRPIPLVYLALASALGIIASRRSTGEEAAPRESAPDWPHYAAVFGITLLSVILLYVAVGIEL
jgi:putative inorganic carbon (hco3(-)) transporter